MKEAWDRDDTGKTEKIKEKQGIVPCFPIIQIIYSGQSAFSSEFCQQSPDTQMSTGYREAW